MKNYKLQGMLLKIFGFLVVIFELVVFFEKENIEKSSEAGWVIMGGLLFSLFGVAVLSFILGDLLSKKTT